MPDSFKFSHIGWAVSSIEKSVPIFSALGFVPHGRECKDVKRGAGILLLKNLEVNKIELVEPLDHNSLVSDLLKNCLLTIDSLKSIKLKKPLL